MLARQGPPPQGRSSGGRGEANYRPHIRRWMRRLWCAHQAGLAKAAVTAVGGREGAAVVRGAAAMVRGARMVMVAVSTVAATQGGVAMVAATQGGLAMVAAGEEEESTAGEGEVVAAGAPAHPSVLVVGALVVVARVAAAEGGRMETGRAAEGGRMETERAAEGVGMETERAAAVAAPMEALESRGLFLPTTTAPRTRTAPSARAERGTRLHTPPVPDPWAARCRPRPRAERQAASARARPCRTRPCPPSPSTSAQGPQRRG